jgi:hypothetical protein
MNISFAYNLEKDTENFFKSFNSVNSKKPTKLQELYLNEVGDLNPAKVALFLQNQKIDIQTKRNEIESAWRSIEKTAIDRMEKLFGIDLPKNIIVYLSLNSRCTYNIADNYFFVYVNAKAPNSTIAHELLHFYTWYAFQGKLEIQGISKELYNEIKESLTVLLNTDFVDLFGENTDSGYTQHQEMRTKIRQMRIEGKEVEEIIQILIANYPRTPLG